jgi:hypothetical protein
MGWMEDSLLSSKTAEEKLLGVFDFLIKWMSESDFRGCAFINIASEIPSINTKIRKEVIRHKNDLQDYLKKIVEDLIASNTTYAGLDTKYASELVYILVEGAIVASQNYGDIWPIEAAQRAVGNFLHL